MKEHRVVKLKADRTVKREIARLERLYADDNTDPVERRIAWTVAHTLRWAREHTVGWPLPSLEPAPTAELIRQDLSKLAAGKAAAR